MKRKFVYGAVSLVTLTLALPRAAWANQPAGPTEACALILMLPVMALFTAIGGGYAVMKARRKKRRAIERIIIGVLLTLLILFAVSFEGMATVAAILFALFAVLRGVQMISWGVSSRRGTGAVAAGSTPARLIYAGLALIVAATYLAGMPLAVSSWSYSQDTERSVFVREFVTHQLAYAQFEKALTGEERFNRFSKEVLKGYRFDISADLKHFTIYAYPHSEIPPWPYRWLSAASSYRGDETGQIRMVGATGPDQLCPPDARVVTKVEESDVRSWLERVSSFHGFDFSEDLAPIQVGGKWGYVDKFGKIAIPPQFDSAGRFSDGRAAAALHGRPVLIDKSGKLIPSPSAR